ncbi:MAG: extracellular solute-binding protein [Spirochaetales bacterium]|nr:extracellular solute-binding protein [Spirochaetales bacterium]
MATIKDIAKLTGLSHTTVSNVINKKGNVSFEKINLVENAAKKLGYSQNMKAKLLRNSRSSQIGLIIPSLEIPEYLDFFIAAKKYIEQCNYELVLFITDNMPIKEDEAIMKISGFEMAGMIAISSRNRSELNQNTYVPKCVYVERKNNYLSEEPFIGFDYSQVANDLAEYINSRGYRNVVFLSGESEFSNNSELFLNLKAKCHSASVKAINTVLSSVSGSVFSMFYDNPDMDLIVCTSSMFLSELKEAHYYCSMKEMPHIVCLSSSEMPDPGVDYFILDYKKLGRVASKYIIDRISRPDSEVPVPDVIAPEGFTGKYSPLSIATKSTTVLNVLFQDTPSSTIIKKICSKFTRDTGIQIRFNTYSYQDQFTSIRTMEKEGLFDVIRLDMSWLSTLREEGYLYELGQLESVHEFIDTFPDYMVREYVQPEKGIYAVPSEPSVQLFFYRKDLFENPLYIRQFSQMYRHALKVPKSYQELLDVSRFFTSSLNPDSPTEFGSSVVMEYPSSAVCDFAPRMLASKLSYSDDGVLDFATDEMLEVLSIYSESFATTPRKRMWWGDAANDVASGRTATAMVYTNHAFQMLNTQSASTAGEIGFATVPGGHPLLGGSSLGVGRHSKHPQEALEFIKWIVSEKMAKTLLTTGGMTSRVSVFSDSSLFEKYPWIGSIEENYRLGRNRTSIFYKGDDYFRLSDFENVLGVALQSMLDNTMTPTEVASFVDRNIRNYVKRK